MERWSSRLGFLFAAVGAAVGLGNIWRFPAVVGQNGGGAYLLPYLIAAFGFAVPLLAFELAIGRDHRADVVTACRQVAPSLEWVGWVVGASVLAILSYYLVITGWVLAFLVTWIVGIDLTFAGLTSTLWPVVVFVLISLVVGAVVSLGVVDGIERLSRWLIPLGLVIVVLLVGYAVTLDGFAAGVAYLFTPDPSALADPFVWSAAFGQVFFSFSVGMGIMLTYGSYLADDTDIGRSAVAIAIADIAAAVLAGVFIFTVVFTVGLEPAAGTELAFVSLPAGFDAVAGGYALGSAFFALLFVAAVSSSVSMLEVGVAAVDRRWDLGRRRASAMVTGAVLVVGLPSAASYSAVGFDLGGRPALDVVDGTVGTLALPAGAVLIVAVFGWRQDRVSLRGQLPRPTLRALVRVVVPAVLIVVTGASLLAGRDLRPWRQLPDLTPLGAGLRVVAVAATLVAFGLVAWLVHRRRPSPEGDHSSRRRS